MRDRGTPGWKVALPSNLLILHQRGVTCTSKEAHYVVSLWWDYSGPHNHGSHLLHCYGYKQTPAETAAYLRPTCPSSTSALVSSTCFCQCQVPCLMDSASPNLGQVAGSQICSSTFQTRLIFKNASLSRRSQGWWAESGLLMVLSGLPLPLGRGWVPHKGCAGQAMGILRAAIEEGRLCRAAVWFWLATTISHKHRHWGLVEGQEDSHSSWVISLPCLVHWERGEKHSG